MNDVAFGSGTRDDPWILKTLPRTSEFEVWKDGERDPRALVVQFGKTQQSYQLRVLEDAHRMLKAHGDWMPLGNADEGKPTSNGTLELWARSECNPVGGYYGLRQGYRGRFADYIAPVLELLGLAEVEHNARNDWLRAIRGSGWPRQ